MLVCAALCAPLAECCNAQTNVTGIIVDEEGKPISGVRCSISGWPTPSGEHIYYSGMTTYVFSDNEGHFSIPLPRSDPLVDLQFDEDGGSYVVNHGVATRVPPYRHAPAFLYNIPPAAGLVRVVMTEGKLLRGRIVEHVKDKVLPVPQADVELQMPHAGNWYQLKKQTDDKGEFDFKISKPADERSWMLYYAGKRFPVDYPQVTPDTVMVLEIALNATITAEPNGAANVSQPLRSGANSTPSEEGSHH